MINHSAYVSRQYIHLAVEATARKLFPLRDTVTGKKIPPKQKQKIFFFPIAFNTTERQDKVKHVCHETQTKHIRATKEVTFLHLSHLGTMFDSIAKQMRAPKGQFSPAWPRSV